MKKLLGILMVFGVLSASADSYLYWMVNGTGSYKYDSVRIAVTDDNGENVDYLDAGSYLYGDGVGITGDAVTEKITTAYANDNQGLYASLGDYANNAYSFAIELLNDGNFVAQSDNGGWVDYRSLASYISNSPMSAPAIWAPTGYAAPEPNSALLMLIGCAMLGLKRKRLQA